MKKYISIIGLILITISFNGCDQFLEEKPTSLLTQESFYKSVDDLKTAVNGIMEPLYVDRASMPGSSRSFQMFIGGDDLTTQATNKTQWIAVDQFNATDVTVFIELTGWKLPYAVIKQCNNILEIKDHIQGDPDLIKKYVALAYFWRGWAHFYATRFYNDIPIVTSTEVNLNIKRDPVLDVYKQIEKDLLMAADGLPASWATEINYPDKYAVEALLSDFYITWAGWPIKDESKYALSAQYAKDVMDKSGASLMVDFADLWKYDEIGTYDNNKESIWEMVYSTNTQVGTAAVSRTIGRNFIQPEEPNGFADFFCEIGFFNRFPSGYRKDITFKTSVVVKGVTTTWQNSLLKHPYYSKYRGSYDYNGSKSAASGQNFVVYRYADILLLYAEAQTMSTGTPDATAYEAVNKVRRRALKLPVDTPNATADLTPGLSKIAFRDAVIDERGWEFAAEEKRWFDLVRTEKVEWAASTKDPLDIQPAKTVSKDSYLFPIPYADRLLNPNLTQNPGY